LTDEHVACNQINNAHILINQENELITERFTSTFSRRQYLRLVAKLWQSSAQKSYINALSGRIQQPPKTFLLNGRKKRVTDGIIATIAVK